MHQGKLGSSYPVFDHTSRFTQSHCQPLTIPGIILPFRPMFISLSDAMHCFPSPSNALYHRHSRTSVQESIFFFFLDLSFTLENRSLMVNAVEFCMISRCLIPHTPL